MGGYSSTAHNVAQVPRSALRSAGVSSAGSRRLGWPGLLMDGGQAAVDVTISTPAGEMPGYLSRPGGEGRWPGVVVLHDGFGIR
jgi:hypothetical protein